jgi:hypothetical protein
MELLEKLKQVCQWALGKLRQAYQWVLGKLRPVYQWSLRNPRKVYRFCLVITFVISLLKIGLVGRAIAQEGPFPHPEVISVYTVIFSSLTLAVLWFAIKVMSSDDNLEPEIKYLTWVIYGVIACICADVIATPLLLFFGMDHDAALAVPLVLTSCFMCILPLVFFLQEVWCDCCQADEEESISPVSGNNRPADVAITITQEDDYDIPDNEDIPLVKTPNQRRYV